MISVISGSNTFPGIVAFIGGFVLIFGLFSFFIKQKLFLSDSLLATILGILFGPLVVNLINPFEWPGDLNTLTLHFTDLVCNIQIMAAAISLPRTFWKRRKRALAILLGPVTIYMWLATAIVFWQLLKLPWLDALILAACTAPTDPVLANSIVNGRFADLHIHVKLRQLLSGESAANDGAATPFFYLGYYLIKYPLGEAIGKWTYEILIYECGVAVIFGLVFGYTTRVALRYCQTNNMIDKNSFLVFELALAFVSSGLATFLGLSSFIATFATGITFAWDGWFAEETEEAQVQEILDMLVNIVFFLFFGAAIPWSDFSTEALPLWKLSVAALLVLLIRRLPAVIALSKHLSLGLTWQEVFFVGWFGPVGVGALFYMAQASILFPESTKIYTSIIYFIVFTSVIVHGIMVPFVHITLIGIRTRTMSKSAPATVPKWPKGVPINTSQISGPVIADLGSTPTLNN